MSSEIDRSKERSTRIMDRLKDETQEYHAKLESLPYFKALIDHRLPLECYVNQLRAMAIIHSVLEHEVVNSEDRRVLSVYDDELKKLSPLQEDLKFFEPRVVFDNGSSIDAALSMTEKIRLRGFENPISLLGYLYVLEGSTLGNHIHEPDIAATFHLTRLNGCRYYSSYRDRLQENWKRFTEKMNSALEDSSLLDPIVESAHEAFTGLEAVYKALYPMEKKEKNLHVTRINPEAGNHPIPDDEREIQAALKASNRGWVEFPYYEHRYGERGKRFSDSDTCWLVTLTSLDQVSMQNQIEWIGRVLATRGMPSIMLEHTLRILHEELAIAVPKSKAEYGNLLNVAEMLREKR